MADAEFFKIPSNPSIDDAKKLAAELTEGTDQPVRLDASGVETMSTPFVLTVLSAMQSRAALTPPAIINGATDEFVAAFTDLGLFQDMMKMEFAT